MSTITFPLKAKQRGNAVLHLQDGLLLLIEKTPSVFIPPPPPTNIPKPPDWPEIIKSLKAERSKKYYGEVTKGLIISFQTVNNFQASGNVNKRTAETLNRLIDALKPEDPPSKYSVSGQVSRSDNTPFSETGLTVQAFDQVNSNKLVPLGSVPLQSNGRYLIPYDWKSYEGHNKPNLVVRLIDPQGDIVVEATRPNTAARSVVNLTVNPKPEQEEEKEANLYTVSGTITLNSGNPLPNIVVHAYDKDLRNEEPLGEISTNNEGYYEISYNSKQFRRAEKKHADLIIRVFDQNQAELAASNIIFNAGTEETINIRLTANQYRGLSEYETYLKRLQPLLENVQVAELNAEDIVFLSGETGISSEHLYFLQKDVQWSEQRDVKNSVFYGLFRQSLPTNYAQLITQKTEQLVTALNDSISQNIIPDHIENSLDYIRARLRELAIDAAFEEGKEVLTPPIGLLLNTSSELNDDQRRRFVEFKHNYAEDNESDFWEKLQQEPDFDNASINAARFTLETSAVLSGHIPALRAVQKQRQKSGNLQRDFLASIERTALIDLVLETVEDDSPEGFENKQSYAEEVAYRVEQTLPTSVIKYRLADDNEYGNNDLNYFFSANTSEDRSEPFDLIHSHVDDYFDNGVEVGQVEDVDGLRLKINQMQRIARVVPRRNIYINMRALDMNGYTSAAAIATEGKSSFIEKIANNMSEPEAIAIYGRAKFRVDEVEMTRHRIRDFAPSEFLPVLPFIPLGKDEEGDPDWSSLFGAAGACECEHCRSVYGPAAYMVDILHFLYRAPRGEGLAPLDVLLSRRPDLKNILLNCTNATTPLPYIDLVNERLEEAVVAIPPVSMPSEEAGEEEQARYQTWLARYQTNRDAASLRAQPEHEEHSLAYQVLSETNYPWALPFSLADEKMNLFSEPLGLSLHHLREFFGYSEIDIAKAKLHLSDATWNLITRSDTGEPMDEIWGIRRGTSLPAYFQTDLPGFLKRAELSFHEFQLLLSTEYLDNAVSHIELGDPCDLQDDELSGLNRDTLNRIYQFLKLARSLNWSIETTDEVLSKLAYTNIVEQSLVDIAILLEITQQFGLTPEEGASLDEDALAKLLRISEADLERFIALSVTDSIASETPISGIKRRLEKWDIYKISGFGIPELSYLLQHRDQVPAVFEPTSEVRRRILQGLLEVIRSTEIDLNGATELEYRLAMEERLTEYVSQQLNLSNRTIALLLHQQLADDEGVENEALLHSLENSALPAGSDFFALIQRADGDSAPESVDDVQPGVYRRAEQLLIRLDKVARLLHILGVNSDELSVISTLPSDSGFLDLNLLPVEISDPAPVLFAGWKIWVQYINIRNSLPKADKKLSHFLAIASQPDTNLPDIIELLADNTGWNKDLRTGSEINTIEELISAFGFSLDDFRLVETYERLIQGVQYLRRWDINSTTLKTIANPSTVKTDLANTLENIAQTKYRDDAAWYKVLTPMMDTLREKKRDALVANLLANPLYDAVLGVPLWTNSNSLYAHYLIDVEMSSCQLTSRIKQANASIQLFIQRCLMNLEKDVHTGADEEYWKQWEWMKRYRVWEANRKVFLYPENWIEPDLRDDKSPFFKDFENALLQDEIKTETVERAYEAYLNKLDQVSYLDVRGLYHEINKDWVGSVTLGFPSLFQNITKNKIHIFARTKSDPYEYYYRFFDVSIGEWSSWEKVGISIQSDHIAPVVFNNRLMLFWAVFDGESRNYEISIHWSEYKNGQWQAPRTNKLAEPAIKLNFLISSMQFRPAVEDGDLVFYLSLAYSLATTITTIARFVYDSCQDTLRFDQDVNSIQITLLQLTTQSIDGGAIVARPVTFHNPSNLTIPLNMFAYFDEMNTVPITNLEEIYEDKIIDEIEWFAMIYRSGGTISIENLIWELLEGSLQDTLFDAVPRRFSIRPSHQYRQITYNQVFSLDIGKQLYLVVPQNRSYFDFLGLSVSPKCKLLGHPYTCRFIETHRVGGISALLAPGSGSPLSRQQVYETTPTRFDELGPNRSILSGPYPFENIDFELDDANGSYNWEIFFHMPLLVADKFSKNQNFKEAQKWFHYIFNPTDTSSEGTPEKFWQVKPFYELAKEPPESLRELMQSIGRGEESQQIQAWRDDPFNPHHIARLRTVAYMKTVVMKYLDNLISWGDDLFQQDTIESINEASQLYMLAAEIIGEQPLTLPAKEEGAINFSTILFNIREEGFIGPFSNVWLENQLPEVAGDVPALPADTETAPSSTIPYFCIPKNKKLAGYRDTIADRLFKIRHCQNITGQERQLALFEPPIDPALLVRARAAGLDIGQVLRLTTRMRLPAYRYSYMYQKSIDLSNEVRSLGGALLSALEKKDAEGISLLRAKHEISLLSLVTLTKEQQIEEGGETIEGLQTSKKSAEARFEYYTSRSETLLSDGEIAQLDKLNQVNNFQIVAQSFSVAASLAHAFPNVTAGLTPGITWGGTNVGNALNAHSSALNIIASQLNFDATMSSQMAGYTRRQEDWRFQAELANKETEQLEKQIAAAEIRLAIAENDLSNHKKQIEQSKEVETYLRNKFTNQELYGWMVSQLSTLHYQAYKVAVELARKTEKAAIYELGLEASKFTHIGFSHWDSMRKGLLAGERLNQELRRMDLSYMEQNKRRLEITKNISLAMLNPIDLIQLRETGECKFSIPEILFDMDFSGHFQRRIKAVSLSIPCVTGPYTSVNATLRLENSQWRREADLISDLETDFGGTSSIATSSAQTDSGLFEFNFRDERYLPFEGAGAISRWTLELPTEVRPFDYDTISDVILHIQYTARDGGKAFKDNVNDGINNAINAWIDAMGDHRAAPLTRAFSLRQEFPTEFNSFLHSVSSENNEALLDISKKHFPHFTQDKNLTLNGDVLLIFKTREGEIPAGTTMQLGDALPIESPITTAIAGDPSLNNLPVARFSVTGSPIRKWAFSIPELPEDIEDVIFVVYYQIS